MRARLRKILYWILPELRVLRENDTDLSILKRNKDYVNDEEKRFYALQEADMVLVENAAKIPIDLSKKCLLVKPNVSGVEMPNVVLTSFTKFEKVVTEE